MKTQIDFLMRIWKIQESKKGKCYFFLSTKSVASNSWADHAIEAPLNESDLKAFFRAHKSEQYDVYFCPHPFSKPKRVKENVLPTCFAWADLDKAKPDSQEPKPQVVIKSSPNRYAALWHMIYFMEPQEAADLSKVIADHWGADACHNLTRVLRLPGTINHKYESKPRVKLLRLTNKKYGVEKFESLHMNELDAREVIKKHKSKIPYTTFRLLTATQAEEGKRSDILWKLNNELIAVGLDGSEIFTLLKASVWNKFRGRKDEDDQLKREIEKANSVLKQSSLAGLDEHVKAPELICPVGIEPEIVRYLWPPYIPLGKLTIVEGDPGLGKSYFTMKLAYHIANGAKFPGGHRLKGTVCIFSAEDGLRDTIIPRLIEFGTNLENVRIKDNHQPFNLDMEGFIELEYYLKTYKPKLLIIDPLVAYLDAELDMNKANHMRSVTKRLAVLAEEFGCAIVALRHLTKSGKEKAIYRGQGSIDITGAARSVLHIGQHPDNEEGRIMCQIKHNLGMKGKSIAYKLKAGSTHPFAWIGECDYTVADLVSQDEMGSGTSEHDKAKTFLEEYMDGQGKMLKAFIIRDAEARGINKVTLTKVKKELKVKTAKTDDGWTWELPNV